MPDIAQIKQALHESMIQAYINDYRDLADNWRNLESKAQGTVTIAGIFIAGALAYVRETSTPMSSFEKILLASSISFLIVSVVLSILALRLRDVKAPLMGKEMTRLVRDILTVEDDTEFIDRLPNYYNDQATNWQNVEDDTLNANHSKALFLWGAHISLVLAIITMAAITVTRIFR